MPWQDRPSLASVRPPGPTCAAAEATARELGLACGLVGEIVRLQTERDEVARIQQQTVQLAETDPLTDLANRRVWDRQLQSQWTLATSTGQPLWLAIVDLDRFKEVNDRDGYVAGDGTLQGCGPGTGRSVAAR